MVSLLSTRKRLDSEPGTQHNLTRQEVVSSDEEDCTPMVHMHQQSSRVDYRLRMPHSIHYAIAAGSTALAFGLISRASLPSHHTFANTVIGAGAIVLAPA